MQYSFLSAFPDPFFKILELDVPKLEDEELENEELRRIIKQSFFPQVNKESIEEAKLIFDLNHSYNECINISLFYFPFYPHFIEDLIRIEAKLSQKEKTISAVFVLFSYGTWVTLLEKLHNTEHLTLLLKAICIFLDSTHTELLACAFINLLALYIDAGDFSSFEEVFPAVRTVFLCCKKLPEAALLVFPAIMKGLMAPNYNRMTDMAQDILSFFYQKVRNSESNDAKEASMQMMQIIEPNFLNFDIDSQRFYANVSYMFNDECAEHFIKVSVDSIVYAVKQTKIKTDYPVTSHIKIDNSENSENSAHLQVNFSFPRVESYPSGLSIESSNIFSAEIEDNLVFDAIFCDALRFLVVGLCNKQELIDTFFGELIKKLPFEKENVSVPVFAFLCNEVMKNAKKKNIRYDTENLSNILPIEQFFSPLIVCTKENCKQKQYSLVNTVRNIITQIFFKAGTPNYDYFLNKLISYPLIFAETFYRIFNFGEEATRMMKTDNNVPKMFSNYLITFKLMNETGKDKAEFARTVVFHVLSIFFQSGDVMQHFFSNNYFVSCYLSQLFEHSLKEFIIGQCLDYLEKCSPISTTLPFNISKISGFLIVSFPDKNYLKLATDIINLLRKCIISQMEYSVLFKDINLLIRESFASLDNSDESRTFFLACIDLFVVLLADNPLTTKDLCYFDAGISNAFPGKVYSVLSDKLVQYLAGDSAATFESNFLIKEPYILFVIFRNYYEYGMLTDVCLNIGRLLTFSRENCTICHKHGFDIFLLDKIAEIWENEGKSEEIRMIFVLITKIARVVSSVSVIRRCISLICPTENKISPNASLALDVLIELFYLAYSYPTTLIQPIDSSIITTKKMAIKENITFAFWLKIGNFIDGYYPKLASLIDKDGNDIFSVYLAGRNIRIQQNGIKQTTGEFLEEESWNFISLVITKAEVQILVNGCNKSTLKIQKITNNNLIFSFGGLMYNSAKPEVPYFLTSFGGFSDMKPERIKELSKRSYIWMRRMKLRTYFIYDPPEKSEGEHFSSIFTTKCLIDSVIPLFKFASYPQEDKNSVKTLMDKTIEILINTLLWSSEVEANFSESKGFALISLLLKEGDNSILTYELYRKFFEILTILSNRSLKQQLIDEILIDIDLWYRADGAQQLQIYSQWTTELFKLFSDYVLKSISFTSVLMKMVIIYNENSSIQSVYHQRDDIKAFDIRTILRQVLIWIATQKNVFKIEDYHLILSVCIESEDNSFVLELVQFIDQIVLAKPSPLNVFGDKGENLIIPLLPLFKKNNTNIRIAIIDTIIDMYNYNAVKSPSLAIQVNILIRRMQPEFITKDLIYHLSQRISDCFDLLPLLSWCLANTHIDNIDITFFTNQFTPKNIDKYWSVWPLLLMNCGNPGIVLNVLRFIIQNDSDDFIDKYNAIEIASQTFGIDSHSTKTLFITELTNQINDHQIKLTQKKLSQYMEIVQAFFFLNRKGACSKQLLDLYKKSPFNDGTFEFDKENKEENQATQKNDITSSEGLINSMLNLPLSEYHYEFGLNLTDDLKWKDKNLALNCVNVLESSPSQTLPLLLVISYFLSGGIEGLHVTISKRANENVMNANRYLIKYVESKETKQPIDEYSVNAMQQQISNFGDIYSNRYNSTLKPLKKFIKQCNQISSKVSEISSSMTADLWKMKKEKVVNKVAERKKSITKLWNSIFSTLNK